MRSNAWLRPHEGSVREYRSPIVDVLSDGQFRALILSHAIFDLGIFMRGAANSWVILELTLSQLWIGLVAGVRFIPIMLLALFGGVISDRFGRRNLMMAAGWHCQIFGRDR